MLSGAEVGDGVVAAYVSARRTRRPAALIAQNNLGESFAAVPGWATAATRRLVPRFDAVVCVAQGLVPTATAVGVRAERTHVIPNGVNVERVRALASEEPPAWLPRGRTASAWAGCTPRRASMS